MKVDVGVITGGEGENNSPAFVEFPFGKEMIDQFLSQFPPQMQGVVIGFFGMVSDSTNFPENKQKDFFAAMEVFFRNCKENPKVLHQMQNYWSFDKTIKELGERVQQN